MIVIVLTTLKYLLNDVLAYTFPASHPKSSRHVLILILLAIELVNLAVQQHFFRVFFMKLLFNMYKHLALGTVLFQSDSVA